MPTALPSRPIDATLSVTKAARLLGVHPNTVRAWSDAGRLRYYRINPRGDRRYRLGDLQRFLTAAESTTEGSAPARASTDPRRAHSFPEPGPVRAHDLPIPRRVAEPAPRDLERARAHDGRMGATGRHELPPEPGGEVAALASLAELVDSAATGPAYGLDTLLSKAADVVRQAAHHHLVVVWELRRDRFVPRATAGPGGSRIVELPSGYGSLARAVGGSGGEQQPGRDRPGRELAVLPGGHPEHAVPILVDGRPWGVLLAVAAGSDPFDPPATAFLVAAARAIATLVRTDRHADEVRHQLHRAEALRRVAGDIGSRLDLDQILAGLVDHAIVLFDGDRGAVFLTHANGEAIVEVSRNLSSGYLNSVRSIAPPSLPASAAAAARPLFSIGYADDPRAAATRAAVVQEGFDTICSAPLLAGDELLGLLNVYHDAPHRWSDDELDTMAALATQASVAIRTAQNYKQMATWAAQLQSIQQLGVRLSRLTSVGEIGHAIATELRQLIDYHNVRVYRLHGDDLIPVAMQGQVGEYVDETPEQLRVKVGQGITGWVAAERTAQNLPDAAGDARSNTIPGTEENLDESMLLAPMLYEDDVLGVLVLSKLGLRQFTDDDLRLLEIYASFAAQAMANADATGLLRRQSDALERQLRSQRELLQVTESILTTLDPTAVFEQIADRLATLVGYDNIAIEIVERATGLLRPLTARGIHALEFMEPWAPGETGIATWVVEHNEPVLLLDERADPRVNQFRNVEEDADGALDGSMIVVPLRGRDGASGVLTLERLGAGNTYTADEFELVKLFAAQVSIALQNAEAHRAVAIRARTDDLTGLLNHGTFREWLVETVTRGEPFSLVMLDLDNFKQVNDELGHQAGDRFLADVSAAIVAASRDTDHVFRYGGDEFTVILPGANPEAACAVAERIRGAIDGVGGADSRWYAEGVAVSGSIGLATYPHDGQTADSILVAADRACFVAKRSGRGRIATADEGLALASEFSLQAPTPVDPPTAP